jgi:hypothetical protein
MLGCGTSSRPKNVVSSWPETRTGLRLGHHDYSRWIRRAISSCRSETGRSPPLARIAHAKFGRIPGFAATSASPRPLNSRRAGSSTGCIFTMASFRRRTARRVGDLFDLGARSWKWDLQPTAGVHGDGMSLPPATHCRAAFPLPPERHRLFHGRPADPRPLWTSAVHLSACPTLCNV